MTEIRKKRNDKRLKARGKGKKIEENLKSEALIDSLEKKALKP